MPNNALDGEYSADNMARMRQGLAPLHDQLGVSKELHPIVPPATWGGNNVENLQEYWPWEHDANDPFRYYSGPTPW